MSPRPEAAGSRKSPFRLCCDFETEYKNDNAMNYVFNGPTLRVGELTFSGGNPSDLPAIIAGNGCGTANAGPAGSINRILYFSGSGSPVSDLKSALVVTSTTKISLVRLKPTFSILGSNDPTKIPFPLRYRLSGTGQPEVDRFQMLDANAPSPVDLQGLKIGFLPTSISFEISSDTDFSTIFTSYLASRNYPAVGFLLSVAITQIQTEK
jgi:hypothetical protein